MTALAPYIEYARKAFAREATYRIELLAEIGSLALRVYLLRALWTALYTHNIAPMGLPLHSMITYATVAMLMSLVLEVDGTRVIREKLREGGIAVDLMKPIVVPFAYFSDGVGQTLVHALAIVPSLLISLMLVHIDVPSAATLVVFFFSFALGYGVNFFVNFLLNGVAFWTLETFGLQLIVRWISDLLSGQILPLAFFPGWFGRAVFALPFAAIYSTPLLVFIGIIPPRQWVTALAVQAAWLAVTAAASYLLWRAAARRVVVQGG